VLVVGASGYWFYDPQPNPGQTWVYHDNGAAWELVGELDAFDKKHGDLFGMHVAASDDAFLVLSPRHQYIEQLPILNAGRIYTLDDCDVDGIVDAVQICADPRLDADGDFALDECQPGWCPWDYTSDGIVGLEDIVNMLSNWGACPTPPAECPWDITGLDGPDGFVGLDDLTAMLSNWGPCPE
jgi:hypothetical protein